MVWWLRPWEKDVEKRSAASEKKMCRLQSWIEPQVILGHWPRERHLGQVPHQHSWGLRVTWPRRASPSHGLFCLLLWAKWSPFLHWLAHVYHEYYLVIQLSFQASWGKHLCLIIISTTMQLLVVQCNMHKRFVKSMNK